MTAACKSCLVSEIRQQLHEIADPKDIHRESHLRTLAPFDCPGRAAGIAKRNGARARSTTCQEWLDDAAALATAVQKYPQRLPDLDYEAAKSIQAANEANLPMRAVLDRPNGCRIRAGSGSSHLGSQR